MKTRFSSAEIAHVWANLTPAEIAAHREGRCPAAMSFRGAAFDSYGTTIARHITGKGKRRGVLLNVTSYSYTTSQHLGAVRRALPEGLPVFEFYGLPRGSNLTPTPREVFDDLIKRAVESATKAPRAWSKATWNLQRADDLLTQANAAHEFFGLRCKRAELGKALEAGKVRAAREARAACALAKRREQQCALETAARVRLAPQVLELWRNHDAGFETGVHPCVAELRALGYYAPGAFIAAYMSRVPDADSSFRGNAALRLSLDGTRVETSQGAQVLVRTVAFLWAFCAKARATATAVSPEVLSRFPRLDYYECREIDARGNVTVGCHRLPFAEIEGIAKALSLPPYGPLDAATCSPALPEGDEVERLIAVVGEVVG